MSRIQNSDSVKMRGKLVHSVTTDFSKPTLKSGVKEQKALAPYSTDEPYVPSALTITDSEISQRECLWVSHDSHRKQRLFP
jgi:hypothetical protein